MSLHTPQEMKKYEVRSIHWILIREGNQDSLVWAWLLLVEYL